MSHFFSKICLSLFISALIFVCPVSAQRNLVLHYDKPAKYFEEALVIGNGSLGATIYGGTDCDRLSLNDITLWTGEPEQSVVELDGKQLVNEVRALLDRDDYKGADSAMKRIQGHYSENYQPLGNLYIEYPDHLGTDIFNYNRALDISSAVASTDYIVSGSMMHSEYFASAPDSVIVVRLSQNSSNGIHALLRFDSLLPNSVQATDNSIIIDGYVAYHSYPNYYGGLPNDQKHLYDQNRGIHFRTVVKVLAPAGSVKANVNGTLEISEASEATILITNVSSFNGFDKDPVKEGKEYKHTALRRIAAAESKDYNILMQRHQADYKKYFDRVSLNLGKTEDYIKAKSTDLQLLDYTLNGERNPELEALYFQYGRYLLISCSRTSGVPANLQGLWNEKLLPPWSCNYTSNINLEENYWGVETTNLSEMHTPLLEFIKQLATTGGSTAKEYYGVDKGWCLAHNTDLWAMTCPVGLNGGDPSWANWNMGGAWVATHIWEHYQFTKNRLFLEEYYPYLKGAAEFCMGWLTEKDGFLLTSPGTSPENKFVTNDGYVGAVSYGSTSDIAMTRECLLDAVSAAVELGRDDSFVAEANSILTKLLPYRIGKKGNLQEWYYDFSDEDPYHRHQSHLFGLYPGHHLSVDKTPSETDAAIQTLLIKGDQTTGWSTGWRVNLYARLRDGEKAYHMYRKLLSYVSPDEYDGSDKRRGGGTYPNLLDAHSPFQIDGNFGGSAGVVEMLVQSTPTDIRLLPALPSQWSRGSVSGLCARGGYEVSLDWVDGKVVSATILAKHGGNVSVHYNGTSKDLTLSKGELVKLE